MKQMDFLPLEDDDDTLLVVTSVELLVEVVPSYHYHYFQTVHHHLAVNVDDVADAYDDDGEEDKTEAYNEVSKE